MLESFYNGSETNGVNNVMTIMAYGQTGAGKTYTIDNMINKIISDMEHKIEFKQSKNDK